MSSSRPRLDVIIVTWNHGTLVDRCLRSLAGADWRSLLLDRLVVVDNASREPYRPPAGERVPPVTLLTNATNVGFAAACNQGARRSRADYLLFLNPDTFVGRGSISEAVATLEGEDRTAIVGIPLVNEGGRIQATCGRFLTAANVFAQVTGLSHLAPAWFPGLRMTEWSHDETRTVDFVSGACLIVRRAVFEQLRGFDERLITYLEDADLALRAHRLGWQTRFALATPVVHTGGWSTGRQRAWRMAHSWRSLVVYGWKHLGWGGASAVTLVVLVLGPLARLCQAAMHLSDSEGVDVCVGYTWLWRLLVRDLSGRGAASLRLESST